MATDTEIYRAADLLVKEYGEMAPMGANIKADQMRDSGNAPAHAIWSRIAKAAEELLSDFAPTNIVRH